MNDKPESLNEMLHRRDKLELLVPGDDRELMQLNAKIYQARNVIKSFFLKQGARK